MWIAAAGHEYRLLVRRSLTDPQELAFYLCHCPARATLEELMAVAGRRWAIEECFQVAKSKTCLDHYQVRRADAFVADAWYRHITLAMLAVAYLAVTAANAPKAPAPGPHPSRDPPSVGTPDRPAATGTGTGLVTAPPNPPGTRTHVPLPATTPQTQRSAAGVLGAPVVRICPDDEPYGV